MGKLTGETPFSAVFSYRRSSRKFIGIFLTGMMMLSCSGLPIRGDRPRGIYHRVKSGETLSVIARAYRADLQELAEINNISNPNRIETDSVIFIPDANQIMDDVMTAVKPRLSLSSPIAGRTSTKPSTVVSKPVPQKKETSLEPKKRKEPPPAGIIVKDSTEPSRSEENNTVSGRTNGRVETETTADQPVIPKENVGKADQVRFDKKRFAWPVKGKVVSHFGFQSNRMYYNGIRIATGEGAAVQAAADGFVIFSATLKDYGETIIIQHEDQYATVYTHLGMRVVSGETRVQKGEKIGFLGKGEDHEEPWLDFEIRYRNKARNPLFFLP